MGLAIRSPEQDTTTPPLKTLTSQSETVLEAYRCDLVEFGASLSRETEVLHEAAARAARDLPSLTQALNRLADIVTQGKDTLSQVVVVSAHSDGDESEQSSASALTCAGELPARGRVK